VTGPDRLPMYKPPYSRITAIDMNTGEHLWWIPVGRDAAARAEHPELQDMDLPNTGTGRTPPMAVTPDMLCTRRRTATARRTSSPSTSMTGEELARVEVPATATTA
jgi:hypothetical protein